MTVLFLIDQSKINRLFFIAQRYASAVYVVVLCLSACLSVSLSLSLLFVIHQ